MKKVLAIILTVVMLFGVAAISTSAEETTATPEVTIITNEGSPVALGVETYFTVKFANFETVKGLDVTITADHSITLSEVKTSGFPNAATENSNYTVKNVDGKHIIRFVDLTGTEDGKIIFKASVDEAVESDPTITVSGEYATDGKTKFDIEAPEMGTFELKREIETTAAGTTTEEEKNITLAVDTAKKFIPQGGVYRKDGDTYIFADKVAAAEFTAEDAGDYVYQSYDIPANGITTFGVSDDPDDATAIRFGNYSTNANTTTKRGTLIFEGDWLALKNYYIQKGYSVQQFVTAIYNNVVATLAKEGNEGKTFVTYTLNGAKINVYPFEQTKYMWKDDDAGILEYSLRLRGMQPQTTYTGVAYTVDANDKVTVSENVKSVKR